MLLTLTLSFVAPALSTSIELEINEVLVAPSAGDQIVEITNRTAAPLDTADFQLAVGSTNEQLPSLLLAPGAFVRVHIGVAGANTPTDLFAPSLSPLFQAAGSVALFTFPPGGVTPGFFTDPDNIRDFVQWGAPFQAFSFVALHGLAWFHPDTFVPAPFVDDSLAFDGSGQTEMDWFRDRSPTLGAPNVQPTANVSILGFQCSPAAAGPMLGAISPPALGSRDFVVDFWTQSLNQPAFLFIGSSTANLPIFGGTCFFHVGNVFAQIPFTSPADGALDFPIPIPDIPALIGQRFVFQVALANGFGFPPGIDLSAALVVDV